MYEKLHIIITLIATAVVALFSYIFFQSLTRTAIALIITIVVFYVLGSIFKGVIDKELEKEKEKAEEEENLTDNENQTEQEEEPIEG